MSRQGHDGSALFVAGRDCRPECGGLSLQPRGQLSNGAGRTGEAMAELAQCLKLRPNDTEALEVQHEWNGTAASPSLGGVDQATARRCEGGSAGTDRAHFRCRGIPPGRGDDGPDGGDAAGGADAARSRGEARRASQGLSGSRDCCWRPSGSTSRRWRRMARWPRRTRAWPRCASGAATRVGARKEANAALELKPSAQAYLVLGRLDLAANIWPRRARKPARL